MNIMETELKTKPTNSRTDYKEGNVARMIEDRTAKMLPSDVFLWASLGSMAASLVLKILKEDKTALFVGQWAPSFLLLGIYNKLVKQQGHEGQD